jgi:hypothetical protein
MPSIVSTTASGAMSVYAADMDGDGRVDILSASFIDNKIAWYKNGGGSPITWTPYAISTTANGASYVYAADIDGDGRIDVLSASELDNKIAWYKNGGGSPPTWTAYTISSTASAARSAIAVDVDSDGRLDVVSASLNDDKIAWYKNGVGAPPTWTPYTISTAADCALSVYCVDVDGDGRVDVLSASSQDGKVAWYRNGGGYPPTWTPYTISAAADGAISVFAADLDGDGRVDVMSSSFNDDKVAWYKNGGGSPPTWTAYTISTTADGAAFVYAADVDSDGRVDVMSSSFNDDKVVWYKNGGGTPPAWTPYTISTTADGVRSVIAVDVDSDGRMDAASASYADNKIAVYTNSMCPRGQYGPVGCAPCTLCPSGRFGTSIGADSVTSGCAGVCVPGYMCPPGSTNATAVLCAAGTYSQASAGSCTNCPAGLYGGNAGLSSSLCEGACSAGYACPAGSTNATAVMCAAGQYSSSGASSCTQCPTSEPFSSPGSGSCYAACPDATWTAWLDVAGVEGAHSCFKPIASASTWTAANATCVTLGSGSHLLTSRQVRVRFQAGMVNRSHTD